MAGRGSEFPARNFLWALLNGPFHKAWAVKNDSRPGCLTFVRPIGLF